MGPTGPHRYLVECRLVTENDCSSNRFIVCWLSEKVINDDSKLYYWTKNQHLLLITDYVYIDVSNIIITTHINVLLSKQKSSECLVLAGATNFKYG